MGLEVKWDDEDPGTGGRRFLRAAKFARRWTFHSRDTRRGEWAALEPSKDVWEALLDHLERRYVRREGVSDEDLAAVRKAIADWRPPPDLRQDTGEG